MGFDPENDRFTPDNYRALETQVVPQIFELQPGDIFYVNQKEVVFDHLRDAWIKHDVTAYDLRGVVQAGVLDGTLGFARIICTHDGLIIDFSHFDQRSWQQYSDRYNRNDAARIQAHPEDYLPIIYVIHNEDELEPAEKVLKEQYNILLAGTELAPILEEIEIELRIIGDVEEE